MVVKRYKKLRLIESVPNEHPVATLNGGVSMADEREGKAKRYLANYRSQSRELAVSVRRALPTIVADKVKV